MSFSADLSTPSRSRDPRPRPARAPRASRSPYLFFSRNTPTFRIRIPSDLQACLGKTEYRRSIGPCSASEAKHSALRLASAAFEVFSLARQALHSKNLQLKPTKEQPKPFAGYTAGDSHWRKGLVTQDLEENFGGYTDHLAGRPLASLTDEEIRSIAEAWLLAALRGTDLLSVQTAHIRNQDRQEPDIDYRINAEAATAARIKTIYQNDLKARKVQRMAQEADRQLAAHGITINPDTESSAAFSMVPPAASFSYLKTCHELLKAQVALFDAVEGTIQGDFVRHDAAVDHLERKQEARKEKRRLKVMEQTVADSPPSTSARPSLTLSQALTAYLDEGVRERGWTDLTRKRAASKFELFQAIIDPDDSLPVNAISAEHLRTFKRTLFAFPANKTKGVNQQKTLADLIEEAQAETTPEAKRMKPLTVSNYCQTVIAFLNWAAKNEYHANPAIAGLLKVEKTPQTEDGERDPFSPEDIAKLFNPETYLRAGLNQEAKNLPDSGGMPSRYWVPLFGLLTGARLEELAQLHLDDFVLVDPKRNVRRVFTSSLPAPDPENILREAKVNQEVVCIHINKGKEYQKLKNRASRRYVPLSSILTNDLGFLSYAAKVHAAAEEAKTQGNAPRDVGRLFPELKKTASVDKYSHKLSHWFARYRKTVGINSNEAGQGKKVFHCFRHTIAFWCDQQGNIQDKAAARYLGHAYQGITFDTYSKDTLPHILYHSITERFTDHVRAFLDIDGLRASTWASEKV